MKLNSKESRKLKILEFFLISNNRIEFKGILSSIICFIFLRYVVDNPKIRSEYICD